MKKLTGNQRLILRSLVYLSTKKAGQIAEEANLGRPVVMNAIAGERPISGEALSALMKSLGLTDNWRLDETVVHIWHVGADIQPFLNVIATIGLNSIWPLSRGLSHDDNEPYTGYFVISGRKPELKHGYPYPPYILIYRDRFTLGRGVKQTVAPIDAKPISPKVLPNSEWGPASISVLSPNQINDNNAKLREAFFGLKVFKPDDIANILNLKLTSNATWDQVISTATSRGLSPDDLLRMISRI